MVIERETSLGTTVRVTLEDVPGRGAKVIEYRRKLPEGRFARSKDSEGAVWPYRQIHPEAESWQDLQELYGA